MAYNVDWLVTAESLDDLEHFPEIRLKFFKFEAAKHNYVLNTSIELPHEDGVTALEFSSPYNASNLLCASSGLDKKVKVWALEEREIIDDGSPLDRIIGETSKNTGEFMFNDVERSIFYFF